MIQRINHSGAVTGYQLDVNNRLVTRIQPEGAVSMTWSPTGRRLTATDARGLTTKTYDPFDRLSSETDPNGYSLSYQRDAEGNITSMTAVVGATSWTETYGFDELNRETSVTADGQLFQLSYDETNQLAELHYPNGLVTTYTRDEMDRLTSIVTRNAQDEVVLGFEYTRSLAGNIITQTEADGRIREFSYDLADRLTEAVVRTATVVIFAEGFDYDGAGNRLLRLYSQASGAPETTVSSYDERDRLLTAGSDTLTWDDDGRLLSRSGLEGYALTWDSEDRLLEMARADGSSLQNAYDVDGVRVQSEEAQAVGSADVANLVVSTERWLSHVTAEAGASSSDVRARYIRAGDQLLAVFRGAERRFYHGDQIGSVRALSDAGGAVSDSYDYLAFGGLRDHAGSDGSPYLFAGEPFEASGAFSYNRARWMEPGSGRFASSDPASGWATDAATLGKYAYARSSPASFRDPTGRFTVGDVLAAAFVTTILASIPGSCVNCEGSVTNSLNSKLLQYSKEYRVDGATAEVESAVQSTLEDIYGPLGFKIEEGQWLGTHVVKLLDGGGACTGDLGRQAVGSPNAVVDVRKAVSCVIEYSRGLGALPDQVAGLVGWAAAHELGHALGLQHRDDLFNVMMSGDILVGWMQTLRSGFDSGSLRGAGLFRLHSADSSRLLSP
ncbi:MAG: hypothetical protein IT384_20050 [Deltaproteobacteria bacterium]|nr:hypothetical protein [Deltaproteobacteria bacterium]